MCLKAFALYGIMQTSQIKEEFQTGRTPLKESLCMDQLLPCGTKQASILVCANIDCIIARSAT